MPRNRIILLATLGLSLATFLVRIVSPDGNVTEPIHLNLARFPQYVALCVVGIHAYRRGWLASLESSQARPWRWAIIPLIFAFMALAVLGGPANGNVTALQGGLTWQSLAYSSWEQLFAVAVIISLLVWFRDRLNGQGRLLKAIGGDTYAVYVCHPAVLVALAVVLGGIAMDLSLKFVLVVPVALTLCFAIGHYLRKVPLLKRVL